jgi:hypothetical protein
MEFGADIIKTNYCGEIGAPPGHRGDHPPVIVAAGEQDGADNTFDVARDVRALRAWPSAPGQQASGPSVVAGW